MSSLVVQARIGIGNFPTHPRRSCQLGPAVWRWRRHYGEEGVERLPRERSRRPGKAHAPLASVARVVALTCFEPPGEITHWTGRAMAQRLFRKGGLSGRDLRDSGRLLRPIWSDDVDADHPRAA